MRLKVPEDRPAESMDRFGSDGGVPVRTGVDLVLGRVRERDAGDLLPVSHELRASLLDETVEGFDQRVGLPGSRAGFETKAAAIVEAVIDALQRDPSSRLRRGLRQVVR